MPSDTPRLYLVGGQPVVVLARGVGPGPRNALVLYADGARTVRPFRGLRRLRLRESRETGAGTGK